jgi:hypothetical protein
MPEATVEDIIDDVTDTVEYVRELGITDMVNSATSWVKAHPTQALIGALALGFLVAVLARRQ